MADVALSITIPDAWVTRTLEVFTILTDSHITLEVRDGTKGSWNFIIPAQDGGESDRDFCERVFRELAEAAVNLVDRAQDVVRFNSEVDALIPAASDVPDDIFT